MKPRFRNQYCRAYAKALLGCLVGTLIVVASNASAQTPGDATWTSLKKKYGALEVPEKVGGDEIWYQFFFLPEIVTEKYRPVFVTVRLRLGQMHRPESGQVQVHARKGDLTEHIGETKINASQSEALLRLIGKNEVFSLPKEFRPVAHEHFGDLGGDRYVLARRDQSGDAIVVRQDWQSVPVENVAKWFMRLAAPFFKDNK